MDCIFYIGKWKPTLQTLVLRKVSLAVDSIMMFIINLSTKYLIEFHTYIITLMFDTLAYLVMSFTQN